MLFGKKVSSVLKIDGMHCEKCVEKVKNALKLIGVNADVDLKLGKANVTFPEKLDINTIIKAVNALGFNCTEVK